MSVATDLHLIEAAALKEAVQAAYNLLGEMDHGLRFLHRMLSEETDHLGLESTVGLWSRAVRSVLDEKAEALEAVIKVLDGYSAKEDAA